MKKVIADLTVKSYIKEVEETETYTVTGLFRKYGKERTFSMLPLSLKNEYLYLQNKSISISNDLDTAIYAMNSNLSIFDWYLKPRMLQYLTTEVRSAPTLSNPVRLIGVPLTSKNFKKCKKKFGFKNKSNREFLDKVFEITFNHYYDGYIPYKRFKSFMNTKFKIPTRKRMEISYTLEEKE